MAQLLPMMLNPETRRSSSGAIKALMVFGVLGVGIIAFIFLSKMFKPFEKIGEFFKNAFKNVGGFFGDAFKNIGGFFGGMFGTKKETVVSLEKWAEMRDIKEPVVHSVIKAHYYGGEGEAEEQSRREFRRYSVEIVRKLNQLKLSEGIPESMVMRIDMVESAFRHVDKMFVRDVPKHFEHVFNRKAEFLRGNLIAGLGRDVYVRGGREEHRTGKLGLTMDVYG